jgi:hypothetical protein
MPIALTSAIADNAPAATRAIASGGSTSEVCIGESIMQPEPRVSATSTQALGRTHTKRAGAAVRCLSLRKNNRLSVHNTNVYPFH